MHEPLQRIVIEYARPATLRFAGPLMQAVGLYQDPALPYFASPPLPYTPKRLTIAMRWKDQGWGNRKSKIWWRVERNGQDMGVEWEPFADVAEHDWTDCQVSVSRDQHPALATVHAGDVLRFWRLVGGGGGHALFISRFDVVVDF